MVFSSLSFAVFFSILFVLYWRIPKKYQWLLLLVASYYFYFSWKPIYGVLVIFTTIIAYFAAIQIEKYPQSKRNILLIASGLVLGQLFVFKYFSLFSLTTDSLLSIFNISLRLPQFQLLLPLGISFFTFQTLGYVIDVYRRKSKAEYNFGIMALYVSFFPSIASGPI